MKVSKVKDSGRKRPWKVDGYFAGRRVRMFFATKGEAEAEMARLAREDGESGWAGERLSPRERLVMAELRDRLAEVGATVEEAVAFFLEHGRAPSRPMRMTDLLEDAVGTKEGEGKSARYLGQLRSSVGQFCRWEGAGGMWAHEITGGMIAEWAEGNGWAGKTRRNYLIDVRTVLEHGRRTGAVRRNVTDGMPLPPDSGEGEVPVLSPMQVARMLARCRVRTRGRFKDRDFRELLPYVVLGCFAGLRPERELGLLRLGDVDLEEGTVVVDAARAKSRRRRAVDLSGNAVALLSAWRAAMGLTDEGWRDFRVCGRNFRKRFERLREACGLLEDWRGDVMRHSFASYHYARWQDEARLKAQMGHSRDSETLWRHYRRRVSRREAERYWGIGKGDR